MRTLPLLVILALGGGGLYYGFSSYHALKVADENAATVQDLRQAWLERANWVNVVPDADKYREERSGIDKWYFTALTDHYNRFPAFKNYYREEAELSGTAKGKHHKKAEDLALRKQYYGLVKGVFDSLKDGSYNPQLTATSDSLRLDLVKIAKRTDGKKGFRVDLVVWGAQRQLDRSQHANGVTVSKMNTAAAFSGMNIKLWDDKGKVLAEMPVTGEPEIKVDYPERWIAEFPPQAVLGYYNLPLMPAEAVKMDLEMTVTSRSPNGMDIPGTFKWEIPVDPAWKLAPGETWEGATTEERSKDYIDGKTEE